MAEAVLAGDPGVRPLVVLGSASPARRTLLHAAGIDALTLPSGVDEEALIVAAGARAADAHWLTEHLARAKAADVAATIRRTGPHPDPTGQVTGLGTSLATAPSTTRAEDAHPDRPILVIGADSMLAFGGQVLGKAATAQEVRDRWAAMSGQVGELVTGHVVVDVTSQRTVSTSIGTTIRFGRPDAAELEAYIASGEPLAVAGSCTIDGLGGAFIDGIDGDHGNVIGLSLPTLRALVGQLGWRWTDLWKH